MRHVDKTSRSGYATCSERPVSSRGAVAAGAATFYRAIQRARRDTETRVPRCQGRRHDFRFARQGLRARGPSEPPQTDLAPHARAHEERDGGAGPARGG